LLNKRALRWSEAVCVIEGPDLVEAALGARCEFEGIFVEEGHDRDPSLERVLAHARERRIRVDILAAGVLARVADAVTPQPICAAVRFVNRTLDDLPTSGTVVLLHDVRDPGNAGTVIRTAEAAGATAVVLSGQAVDPFNPKTLRAAAGATFRVPVAVVADVATVMSWYRSRGRACAAVARDGVDYRRADFSKDVLLAFGNEGDGLGDDVLALCDERLTIPMAGETESLNVAASAAVLLFAARDGRENQSRVVPAPSIESQ
jgi:RNA methyltransferase, TrmH family